MSGEEILSVLKQNKPLFESQFGVKQIGLFGSYYTGKNTKESDVDIFVEQKEPSYDLLCKLWTFLETRLNKKVDLIRKGPHLSERFLQSIEKEIIYA
jgi:uncharacterized protein